MHLAAIGERQSSRIRALLLTTSCIGSLLALPDVATAQAQDPASSVQEVVVTAQRREQKLMDVPVAVSAVTGATLAQTGIRETRDITQVLPGITFNDNGPNDTFAIRGVSLNDVGDSNESPIAYYRDDVYIADVAGIQSEMFDVSRVEVLRGPQGTLFGRNATGGVVQLISNQPTPYYTGDLSLQYGSYNQVIVNAAGGGPLLGDVVLGRTAFTYDRDDGWQHNVVTDTRTARANNWAFRQLVDVEFTSNFKGQFNVHLGRNDDVPAIYGTRGGYDAASGVYNPQTGVATGVYCTQAQVIALAPQCTNVFGFRDPNPSPTKAYSTLADPPSKLRNFGSSVTLDYGGGWFDLKSITAYESTRKFYYEDGEPAPEAEFIDLWGATRKQISQELRASGDAGALHWTAGLYYFTERLTNGYWGAINLVPIFGTYGNQNFFHELTNAGAGFGQVDYKLPHDLTLTMGIRYSQERKKLDITDSLTAPTYEEEDISRAHATTWRVALDWKFAPRWLAYTSASTGFKSPGFNTSAVVAGGSAPSQAEHITSYELGAKGGVWDNRIQLTGAIYYNHYENFQLVDTVPDGVLVISRLVNIPLAKIYGAEADISARPIRDLYLDLNASLTHSKIVAPGDYIGALDLNNTSVTNTPKVTVKASAEYHFDSISYGEFSPHANFDYQSSFFANLSCQLYTSCIIPSYYLLNLGIEWTPPGQEYHFDFFVNNVTDVKYQTGSFYAADVNGLVWGRPRLMGVRVFRHW